MMVNQSIAHFTLSQQRRPTSHSHHSRRDLHWQHQKQTTMHCHMHGEPLLLAAGSRGQETGTTSMLTNQFHDQHYFECPKKSSEPFALPAKLPVTYETLKALTNS
jgi:hypothetical protein